MDENKALADMLYVGTISVDVGYGPGGTPQAATTDIGGADLGGVLSVELIEYLYGDEDIPDGHPRTGSVGMWKTLLTQMRDHLARCFVFGQMRMTEWNFVTDDAEDEKNLDAAITELGDEHFLIPVTPEHAMAALASRKEDNERVRQGLESLLGYTQAQQEYEGEDISVGEAVEREKKGTENIRRIVEGEGDQPEGDEGEG
jgi:hypothetical protein